MPWAWNGFELPSDLQIQELFLRSILYCYKRAFVGVLGMYGAECVYMDEILDPEMKFRMRMTNVYLSSNPLSLLRC